MGIILFMNQKHCLYSTIEVTYNDVLVKTFRFIIHVSIPSTGKETQKSDGLTAAAGGDFVPWTSSSSSLGSGP